METFAIPLSTGKLRKLSDTKLIRPKNVFGLVDCITRYARPTNNIIDLSLDQPEWPAETNPSYTSEMVVVSSSLKYLEQESQL